MRQGVDSRSRFFVTGGTLRPDAPSYIRRSADDDLLSNLLLGEFCYVLNARQMGKSSLMASTAVRLTDEGVKTVLIDLTAIGLNVSIEQWYYGLSSHLLGQLGLDEELSQLWEKKKLLGPQQRWASVLTELMLKAVPGPVTVFIDEIDLVRSLPFPTDEFFAGIREFYNRRGSNPALCRLTFCLLGVTTPAELIEDPATTPFNIGVRVSLEDFCFDETLAFGAGLNHGRDTYALLKRVFYWTDGHPYLTQRLCKAVSERPEVVGSRDVDELCKELFLSPDGKARDDNLLFVRDRLRDASVPGAPVQRAYLRVLRRKRKPESLGSQTVLASLSLSGAVKAKHGFVHIRNRLYRQVFDRQWVLDALPDSERRRARRAFWSGFARATALYFGACVVLALAVYGYDQRSAASNTARNLAIERSQAREAEYFALIHSADRYLSETPPEVNSSKSLLLDLRNASPDQCGIEWSILWGMCVPPARTLWHSRQELDSQLVYLGSNRVAAFECPSRREYNLAIRDVASGKALRLTRLPEPIVCLTAVPKGRLLMIAPHRVDMRDISTGNLLRAFQFAETEAPNAYCLSSDGTLLVVRTTLLPECKYESLHFFRVSDGTELLHKSFKGFVYGLGLPPRSHVAYFGLHGGSESSLYTLDLTGSVHQLGLDLTAEIGHIERLAFDSKAPIVAVNGSAGWTAILDVSGPKVLKVLRTGSALNERDLRVEAAKKLLTIRVSPDRIDAWSFSGTCKSYPTGKTSWVDMPSDGRVLIGYPDRLEMWSPELSTSHTLRPAQGSRNIRDTVSFRNDGTALQSIPIEGQPEEWSVADGQSLSRPGSTVPELTAESENGRIEAKADANGVAVEGSDREPWLVPTRKVWKLQMDRRGKRLLILNVDDELFLYDLEQRKLLASNSEVQNAWLSPDGSAVAAVRFGTNPDSDAKSMNAQHKFPVLAGRMTVLWQGSWRTLAATDTSLGFEGVAFEPKSRNVLVVEDFANAAPHFLTFDELTGMQKADVSDPIGEVSEITAVASTPDGQRIVAASSSGRIQIRDARSLQMILELEKPETESRDGQPNSGVAPTVRGQAAQDLACSPDGSSIVASYWDGTVVLWRGISVAGSDRRSTVPNAKP